MASSSTCSSDSSTSRIMASYKPKMVKLQPRISPDPEYDELLRQRDEIIAYCVANGYSVSRARVLWFRVKFYFTKYFTRSYLDRHAVVAERPMPLLSSLDLEDLQTMESRNEGSRFSDDVLTQDVLRPAMSILWDRNKNFIDLKAAEPWELKGDIHGIQPYASSKVESPIPRVQRNFSVYYLFGHVKSFFGFGDHGHRHGAKDGDSSDRHIKFPEEVEQRAEERGDVMGKDRDVKRSDWFGPRRRKHKKVFDQKRKRKVVELAPELGDDVIIMSDEEGCCGGMIGRILYGSGDVHERVKTEGTKGKGSTKFSLAYKKAVGLFANSIELAGEFVEGNLITIEEADKIFKFPDGSDLTAKLNFLAAQLWMFAFAIHDLFKADASSIPTKSEFSKLISNFGILAEVADEISVKMYSYSKIHVQYAREWAAALKKMGGKRFTSPKMDPVTVKVPKPGTTLRILKAADAKEKEVMQLRVIARLKSETPIRWSKFNNISKEARLNTLADLLDECSESINKIGTQVRFFIDDMESGRFEEDDIRFITRLYLLDDLLKYLAQSKETSEQHRQNLTNCMTNFAKDVRNLLERGQAFIDKVEEVNDMIQLCNEYMKSEYSIHLHINIVETNKLLQIAKTQTQEKPKKLLKKLNCFRCREAREFHYKPEEFYRTEFRDAFKLQPLSLPKAELCLKNDKSNDDTSVSVRFAKSTTAIEKFTEERDWKIERSSTVPKIDRRMSMARKSIVGEPEELKTILKRLDQPEGAIAPDAFDVLKQEAEKEKVKTSKEAAKPETVQQTPPTAKPKVEVEQKSASPPKTEAPKPATVTVTEPAPVAEKKKENPASQPPTEGKQEENVKPSAKQTPPAPDNAKKET